MLKIVRLAKKPLTNSKVFIKLILNDEFKIVRDYNLKKDFEMKVDEEIKEIKKRLDILERRISSIEVLIEEKPKKKKKISINEFVISKKPSDDNQKTLAIGYYLEKYESYVSFNSSDLRDGFQLAKEREPPNINECVNRNIRKGFMMERKEKKDKLKSWTLTNSGVKFVEKNFKEEGK